MPKPCKIPDRIDPSTDTIRPAKRKPSNPSTAADALSADTPPRSSSPPAVLLSPLAVSESGAASMIGVSPRYLWELRRRGKIHPFKLGNRVLYAVSELRRFVELQMQKQHGQRIASDVGESPSSAMGSSNIPPHEFSRPATIGCDSPF